MGTLNAIDTTSTPSRADESRTGPFASELDLPSWEEFTDARERFFANLAAAPRPAPRRGPAADTVARAR